MYGLVAEHIQDHHILLDCISPRAALLQEDIFSRQLHVTVYLCHSAAALITNRQLHSERLPVRKQQWSPAATCVTIHLKSNTALRSIRHLVFVDVTEIQPQKTHRTWMSDLLSGNSAQGVLTTGVVVSVAVLLILVTKHLKEP